MLPRVSAPLVSVPVTTTPLPFMVKTRSIDRRGLPASFLGITCKTSSSILCLSSSILVPVLALTLTIGALENTVPSNFSRISSSTRPSQSGSLTTSILFKTTMPCFICSRFKICKCSSVCGIHPSSAAITSRAASIPPTPAIIVLTKSSWPGTSTIPIIFPDESRNQAKPRSMVISRSFSSGKRSGSMDVNAWIRADLPWSICPAVPIIAMAVTSISSGYELKERC